MIERKTSDHLHQGAQDAPEAWNMLKADQDNMAAETRPLQCFLVEDSGLILRGLIDTLQEMLPLRVVGCAGDEAGAKEWLERSGRDVDLMIVDIFLKQGTGLEVLKHANGLNLPCHKVVLTNYATPDMRTRSVALGADRVFDKSSELEELIDYCASLSGRAG
jgi:DNA-binding NarL/FixJ family response regulator